MTSKEPRLPKFIEKFSSIILLGLSILLIFSLTGNISRVKRTNYKVEEKKMEVEKLESENEELLQKNQEAESEEFIERQLRDNLGLAREGEIVLVMPPDDVLRKFAPNYEEEEEVLPEPNWKKWVKLFL